jgi:hypothetical protein
MMLLRGLLVTEPALSEKYNSVIICFIVLFFVLWSKRPLVDLQCVTVITGMKWPRYGGVRFSPKNDARKNPGTMGLARAKVVFLKHQLILLRLCLGGLRLHGAPSQTVKMGSWWRSPCRLPMGRQSHEIVAPSGSAPPPHALPCPQL